MKIYENILRARELAGMTQVELAKKSGVSYSSIQKYELGMGNITVNNLEKIASALKTTSCVLMSGDVSANMSANMSVSVSANTTIKPEPRYSFEEEQLMAWYARLSEDDKEYYAAKIKADALETMRYRKNNPEPSTENSNKEAA